MAVTAEVEAVNSAEDDPAGMAMDAGTETAALLTCKLTRAPPTGAPALRVAAQAEVVPPATDAGLQVTPDKLGGELPDTEMVAPVCATVDAVPDPKTEELLATVMGIVEADAATVKLTEATTPFNIGLAFMPLATHVYAPADGEHDSVLPAAEAEEPSVAVTADIAEDGYPVVHSRAAGSLPATEARVRFSVTVPPAGAMPEASVKVDWPNKEPLRPKLMATPKRALFNEVRLGESLQVFREVI